MITIFIYTTIAKGVKNRLIVLTLPRRHLKTTFGKHLKAAMQDHCRLFTFSEQAAAIPDQNPCILDIYDERLCFNFEQHLKNGRICNNSPISFIIASGYRMIPTGYLGFKTETCSYAYSLYRTKRDVKEFFKYIEEMFKLMYNK